jgi:glycosyltransferase involved in cell wall biosynthesis
LRLLIIADTFPPNRSSGAILLNDLAQELSERGNQITVLSPGGSESIPLMTKEGPVQILRVQTPSIKDIGNIFRVVNEFLLSHKLEIGLKRSGVSFENWDGVIWYSPTIFLGPLAKKIMSQSDCPGYLILRDIFPEWAVDLGLLRKGLAYRFFKHFELYQYRLANWIGTQSAANMPYLKSISKEIAGKTELLDNWLGKPEFKQISEKLRTTLCANEITVVYAENMGLAQGLQVFIEAANYLDANDKIRFLFIGRGSEASVLRELVERLNIRSIDFYDEIGPQELNTVLEMCDLGIVSLDERHKTHNIPGKFLAYLRAGLPVIAKVNKGNELIELISKEEIGEVFDQDNPENIAKAIIKLGNNPKLRQVMKTNAIQLFEKRFEVSIAAEKISHRFRGNLDLSK